MPKGPVMQAGASREEYKASFFPRSIFAHPACFRRQLRLGFLTLTRGAYGLGDDLAQSFAEGRHIDRRWLRAVYKRASEFIPLLLVEFIPPNPLLLVEACMRLAAIVSGREH
jgi:hypothetical protein